MWQKLPVYNFEWIKDTSQESEESDKGCFLEADVQYLEKLHELHDLPFLPERMKIGNIEKLVTNLHDTTQVIYIRNLKQALNHGVVF